MTRDKSIQIKVTPDTKLLIENFVKLKSGQDGMQYTVSTLCLKMILDYIKQYSKK